jgi:hypothetical protein
MYTNSHVQLKVRGVFVHVHTHAQEFSTTLPISVATPLGLCMGNTCKRTCIRRTGMRVKVALTRLPPPQVINPNSDMLYSSCRHLHAHAHICVHPSVHLPSRW